jgi:hypothetical protein
MKTEDVIVIEANSSTQWSSDQLIFALYTTGEENS